jgi:tripartite-type tricarboxylate transporter receptor subunit TctC
MTALSGAARIAILCVSVVLSAASFAQQVYPVRSIRLIVPFPPGGSIDPVARMLAPKLTESWGQQVIVDNRPGANGAIGTEMLAKAAPDGYTLVLLGGGTHVINALLVRNLPYDSVKDFAPVATVQRSDYVLGILAPARTPKPIIDRLAAEVSRIVVLPDVTERITGWGSQPLVSTPEQFAVLMAADFTKFAEIIKTANIRIE